MLSAFLFQIIVNTLKVIEAKANTWRKAFFASIPIFLTAKTSWLLIGAPSIILQGFHLHHYQYGFAILLYSVFSKFFKKYEIYNHKILFVFSTILLLDGFAAVYLV